MLTVSQCITTLFGAIFYSFILNKYFNIFTDGKSVFDGFVASTIMIGLFWAINHGIDHPMIIQSGPIWMDMAVAAGAGALIKSLLILKERMPKSSTIELINWKVLLDAIIGGVIAGILLQMMG